jgi:exosortase/archaeosortase family protein
VIVATVATVGAYHYSLDTLTHRPVLDSSFGYLAMAPFVVVLLVALRCWPDVGELDIHDRQTDLIIGLPLLTAGVLIMLVLPGRLSTFFWVWRLDLLALPFFAAGVVCLLFGLRTLWRLRPAVVALFLIWPAPHVTLLERRLAAATDLQVSAVRAGARALRAARPLDAPRRSTLLVTGAGNSFTVDVAPVFGGVAGLAGFVLLAGALAAVLRGRRSLRLLWLAVGAALFCALNLARVILVVAAAPAGRRGGVEAGLHQLVGLGLLAATTMVMIAALPLFRLRTPVLAISTSTAISASTAAEDAGAPGRPVIASEEGTAGGAGTSGRVVEAAGGRPRRPAVRRARSAVCLVALAAVLCGLQDGRLTRFRPVATDLGVPRLAPFGLVNGRLPGWTLRPQGAFTWTKRLLGADSTWNRYLYAPRSPAPAGTGGAGRAGTDAPAGPAPRVSVIADVVSTSSYRSLSSNGLSCCYQLRGFHLLDHHSFTLAGGVTAEDDIYYSRPTQASKVIVHWDWPVRAGRRVRYERVILLVQGTGVAGLPDLPPPPPSTPRLGDRLRGGEVLPSGTARRLIRVRGFLLGFGRELADSRLAGGSTREGGL